jgi:hypothetical protein
MSTTQFVAVPSGDLPPSSSLDRVLAGLGHDCPGRCSAAADELGAHVWFVRRRPPGAGRSDATLVVLDATDYGGPMHRSRQLMRDVNDCVRDDGIRVTERRIDDSGRALATVSSLHDAPSATPLGFLPSPTLGSSS